MFSFRPNGYYVIPDMEKFQVDRVAPGYYTVAFDQQQNCFYLKPIDAFTLVPKIYGDSLKHSQRILDTFYRRTGRNTAAAFEGVKGSGKTLLLKHISMQHVASGGIVIVVNDAYSGDEFNTFLQSFTQSKIVVFDEFEKVYYEKERRNAILTLLDGTYSSHTLFLITTNTDMYSNNQMEYFSNRPGRVYFNIKFAAVDLSAITEYCEDNLINKGRFTEIREFINKFNVFNMDMLSVLVDELNLNPELSVKDLSEFLNIKPDRTLSQATFEFTVEKDGKDVLKDLGHCMNSVALDNFLGGRDEWNVYTVGSGGVVALDEDSSVDTSAQEVSFDVWLEHRQVEISQDPVSKLITIWSEKEQLKITARPVQTDYLSQAKLKYIF